MQEQINTQQVLLEATADECSNGIDDITAHVHLQHDKVSSMITAFHTMSDMTARLLEEVQMSREETKAATRAVEKLEQDLAQQKHDHQAELHKQGHDHQHRMMELETADRTLHNALRTELKGDVERLQTEVEALKGDLKLSGSHAASSLTQLGHEFRREIEGLAKETRGHTLSIDNTKVLLADGFTEMRELTTRLTDAVGLERRERQGEVELLKEGRSNSEAAMKAAIGVIAKEEQEARHALTERLTERHLAAEKASDTHRVELMEHAIKARDEFHKGISGMREEVRRDFATNGDFERLRGDVTNVTFSLDEREARILKEVRDLALKLATKEHVEAVLEAWRQPIHQLETSVHDLRQTTAAANPAQLANEGGIRDLRDALTRLREEVSEVTTRSLVQQEAASFNKVLIEESCKRIQDKIETTTNECYAGVEQLRQSFSDEMGASQEAARRQWFGMSQAFQLLAAGDGGASPMMAPSPWGNGGLVGGQA